MERRLIARGLLAGAVAGTLAFLFARLFAEPVIGRAIVYEDGRAAVAAVHSVHEHGVELFTRGVQANAGLGFGVLIFGVAMGALFAVVFCITYGRVGNLEARLFSALLAAIAFIAVYLVPFLKYPANPPAVGQADTIGARTGWYLVAVLASVMLTVAVVWLARTLANRLGGWNARPARGRALRGGDRRGDGFIARQSTRHREPMRDAFGAIIYPGFPADVLYQFRLLSLGTRAGALGGHWPGIRDAGRATAG